MTRLLYGIAIMLTILAIIVCIGVTWYVAPIMLPLVSGMGLAILIPVLIIIIPHITKD